MYLDVCKMVFSKPCRTISELCGVGSLSPRRLAQRSVHPGNCQLLLVPFLGQQPFLARIVQLALQRCGWFLVLGVVGNTTRWAG